MTKGSLSFQLNGMFVVAPGKNTALLEPKSEFMVAGTGSKKFPSGSIGLIESKLFPFPRLDTLIHESWLGENSTNTDKPAMNGEALSNLSSRLKNLCGRGNRKIIRIRGYQS